MREGEHDGVCECGRCRGECACECVREKERERERERERNSPGQSLDPRETVVARVTYAPVHHCGMNSTNRTGNTTGRSLRRKGRSV